MDCRYIVDLEYDLDYSCEESGCKSEGICRCGRISNPRVTSVESWEIAKHFSDHNVPLQYHAIERYCSRLETEDFDIELSPSYYGYEIDEVKLRDDTISEIVNIKSLQDADLIEFVLRNEYDSVLPQHRNRQWLFTHDVSINEIVIGKNRSDIDKARLEFYQRAIANDYAPILLCEYHDGRYRLIDGYHRFFALQNLKREKVNIIYYVRNNNQLMIPFELGGAL